MTVRQFISDINEKVRAYGIDSWIPPKTIYSNAQSAISSFLSRSNSASRLIYKNDRALTEIDGIEMQEVPVTTCDLGDTYNCERLMRSKLPLPNIYTSKFGDIVPEVMSINFGQEYTNCFTPKQYKAISKREFQDPKLRYFYILNNFLYIPIRKASERSPEQIRILALFRDRYEVYKFVQAIGGCPECTPQEPCKKLLDFEMVLPDFLEDDVKGKVTQDLANVYLKIVPDEYPNLEGVSKNNQKDLQDRKITNS